MRRRAAGASMFPALGILTLGILAGGGQAEEAVLRSGDALEGAVRREGGRVYVNSFGCSMPGVLYGTRELDEARVSEVRPSTLEDVRQWLERLPPGDVKARRSLLALARRLRAKAWVRRIAEEILAEAPEDDEALDVVGGAERFQERRREEPALDRGAYRQILGCLRAPTGAARQEAASSRGTGGFLLDAPFVERVARSLREGRGPRHDIPLRWGGDRLEGATYSLLVPSAYDGLTPRPLVLALHGGGMARSEDGRVIGSARDGFELFATEAERRGWFLVAPTALEGPWPSPRNAELLEAVLEEVTALHHVDLDRVYVVGHGGGGDGALWFAAKEGARFAAVGAAGAGALDPARTAQARGVAVWLAQGDDDPISPLEDTRKLAERLRGRGPSAYCEVPGGGHGFSADGERALFAFLAPQRPARTRTAWPRSSFRRDVTIAETQALGDPRGGWGVDLEGVTMADLLRRLARGDPDAEYIAHRLAELSAREPIAAGAVEVLRADGAPWGRAWAAWLLGRVGGEEAVFALADVVRSGPAPIVGVPALEALARLGAGPVRGDLRLALVDLAREYARPGPDPARLSYERFEATRHAVEKHEAAADAARTDAPQRHPLACRMRGDAVRASEEAELGQAPEHVVDGDGRRLPDLLAPEHGDARRDVTEPRLAAGRGDGHRLGDPGRIERHLQVLPASSGRERLAPFGEAGEPDDDGGLARSGRCHREAAVGVGHGLPFGAGGDAHDHGSAG